MDRNIKEQLNDLCCNDIAPKIKRRKRPSYYLFQLVRAILFLVCLGVFLYSANSIVENFTDYEEGEKIYGEIKNEFENLDSGGLNQPLYHGDNTQPLSKFDEMLVSDGVAPPVVSNEDIEEFLKIKNKLTLMKQEYPDLYGWLTVTNTNIDYPVMRGNDNSFYVDHAADGKANNSGAIFADFRCTKPTYETQNLVIYGHNIRSWGTMFNGITNFFNPNYYQTHRTITLYTFDGIYEYEIISIFETDIYDDYTRINFSQNSFSSFVAQTIEKSANSVGEVKYDDFSKLITLSTCSNSFDKDNRYALVGMMTKSVTLK